MSVFTTKSRIGKKVTVVASNVAFVENEENGKATVHFVGGTVLPTDVGYDSVRRNVARALAITSVVEDIAE